MTVALIADRDREAGREPAPIGDSLGVAITILREPIATVAMTSPEEPKRIAVQQRLLARHPELCGRFLLKQQRQAAILAQALVDCGASPAVAALAVQLALGRLHAASQLAGDPGGLPAAVDDAFDRLAALSS